MAWPIWRRLLAQRTRVDVSPRLVLCKVGNRKASAIRISPITTRSSMYVNPRARTEMGCVMTTLLSTNRVGRIGRGAVALVQARIRGGSGHRSCGRMRWMMANRSRTAVTEDGPSRLAQRTSHRTAARTTNLGNSRADERRRRCFENSEEDHCAAGSRMLSVASDGGARTVPHLAV